MGSRETLGGVERSLHGHCSGTLPIERRRLCDHPQALLGCGVLLPLTAYRCQAASRDHCTVIAQGHFQMSAADRAIISEHCSGLAQKQLARFPRVAGAKRVQRAMPQGAGSGASLRSAPATHVLQVLSDLHKLFLRGCSGPSSGGLAAGSTDEPGCCRGNRRCCGPSSLESGVIAAAGPLGSKAARCWPPWPLARTA